MKHVVTIPVKASLSDLVRVKFLMRYSGQVRNATLGTMINRVEQLKRDPRWRGLYHQPKSKGRSDVYNHLKKEYQISEFDTIHVAQAHAKDSVWLSAHLDGRIITSIGREVWIPVSQWLHAAAGKPRFTKSSERCVLSGNDQRAGLRYKRGYIVHTTKAINQALREKQPLGEKLLKMRVDWQSIPKKRRKYYQERESQIKKVSLIIREDGEYQLEAHLVFDCLVYRHENKIKSAQENLHKRVSFDLGPSTLAYVSPENQTSGIIQPSARLCKEIKRERAKRRRWQRLMERSKRAVNPESFNEQGQYIPGKRLEKSENYISLQARVRASHARERLLIRQYHSLAASKITNLGLNLITEKDTIKEWAENGYGKSVTTLAPAALKARVFHEARVLREHHGLEESNKELNTYYTHLSQSCFCGTRARKDLTDRVHECQNEDCLAYQTPLHRDKYAALLGLWVKELGSSTNSKGKKTYNEKLGVKKLLDKTYHTREHWTVIMELCSISSLDRETSSIEEDNLEVTPDSMRSLNQELKPFSKDLGQAKTSSKRVKIQADHKITESLLSKSSRSPSLRGEREERVNLSRATDYIKHHPPDKKSSGV